MGVDEACAVCRPRGWLAPALAARSLGGTPQLSGGSNSGLAAGARPVRTRYLHSARMILSDVLTCTVPPLRVESSLLKTPIPAKNSGLTRTRQICTQNSIKVEDALLTPPWLPPPDGMALAGAGAGVGSGGGEGGDGCRCTAGIVALAAAFLSGPRMPTHKCNQQPTVSLG